MQRIVNGVQKFQKDVFSSAKDLFARLAGGQHPEALFITCSDSRVVPSLFTQSNPGDLFELQNAGNIVPPWGAGGIGEAATIEYAVAALKVQHLIVCGHSQCGAMSGLLNPQALEELPAVRSWLNQAEATRRIVKEKHADVTDPAELLAVAVQENVLVQLEHLRTHPAVAAAVARKQVRLHGWVYHFETGEVLAYDPQQEQFRPLGEVSAQLS